VTKSINYISEVEFNIDSRCIQEIHVKISMLLLKLCVSRRPKKRSANHRSFEITINLCIIDEIKTTNKRRKMVLERVVVSVVTIITLFLSFLPEKYYKKLIENNNRDKNSLLSNFKDPVAAIRTTIQTFLILLVLPVLSKIWLGYTIIDEASPYILILMCVLIPTTLLRINSSMNGYLKEKPWK
jgi:hypothetical protein